MADDASEQTDLPSSPPEIKRPRTAAPAQPHIPTTETLSYSQHAKLIKLIQAHGGTLFQSEGDMATFTLPPAANIKFQIDYFCLKQQMLRNDQEVPGGQAFLDSSQATFRYWLNEVSSINQPNHIEHLLATGLGKHEGPMLRELAERARTAGSLKAAEALSDWPEYWVDGVDLEAHSWPTEFILSTGSSDEPLLNGKSYLDDYLRQSFLRRALSVFKPSDVAGGLHRLFPPERQPASGPFRLRSRGRLPKSLHDLVRACGAVIESCYHDCLSTVVCSGDFDSTKFQALLLERQASETAESAERDAALVLAAHWGDEALYHTLQAREPADRYEKLRPLLVKAAAGSGAVGIVTQLLAEDAAVDYHFMQVLDQAASTGRTAVCKILFKIFRMRVCKPRSI